MRARVTRQGGAVTARRGLPEGLGQAFGVAEARASGVSADRLRARDLETPFWGARIHPEPSVDDPFLEQVRALRERCRAYCAVAPPRVAFSHETAARLWGIPLPRDSPSAPLDVTVPGRAVRRRGVRGHSAAISDSRMLGGLPVVAPAVAWLQLAATLTLDELIVAGDYLVRRKRPLCTLDELRVTIAGAGPRRHVTRAHGALLEVRSGTDSPPESRVRLALVRAGLPEPLVGYEVHDDGYWVGTPDLAYPDHRIAIEYQGDGHRSRTVFEDDIDRLERFHAADWHVLQVTASQLRSPASLVSRVEYALRRRAHLFERTSFGR